MSADSKSRPSALAFESFVSHSLAKSLPWACIFFFLFAGLFIFANCPPLWRDDDGLIQIAARPSDMTVLQYPIGYPAFSRLHVYAAQIIQARLHHKKASINVRKGVTLNDAGIYALVLSQQMALALALTAFVQSCCRSWQGRFWLSLLLISNASFFIIAHLISTEALGESLIIAFVALGLRLFQSGKLSAGWLLFYGFGLYSAIMTRHTNAIFAMLLPVACLIRFVVDGIRTKRAVLGPAIGMAVFVAIGISSIALSNLTTRIACRIFDVEYRSISARTTSERLGFVDDMTSGEREAFLASLESKTNDPVVKEAIPALARGESWVNQRAEIERILHRDSPGIDDKSLALKADAYLDNIAGLYYRSFDRHLIDRTIHSIWLAFAGTSVPDVSQYYLKTAAWSLDLYASTPDYNKKTRSLEVCSPAAKNRIIAFELHPWVNLWKGVPHGAIITVASIVALVFLLRKTNNPLIPIYALATVITGVTATCLTFVLVNYLPRFTAVADQFSFLSLAMVLAHWIDSMRPASNSPSPVKPRYRI